MRSFVLFSIIAMTGCGADTTPTADVSAAFTPSDGCYVLVERVAKDSRSFPWPGPDPWNGKSGWVVVVHNNDGSRDVYGITKGPNYTDNQVVWFDRDAPASEVDALRCLPENLHCPGLTGFSSGMGQVGVGNPPAGGGDPNPFGTRFCVPKAVFDQPDIMCRTRSGEALSCPCTPHACRPGMRGAFDDGCGGEICCGGGTCS